MIRVHGRQRFSRSLVAAARLVDAQHVAVRHVPVAAQDGLEVGHIPGLQRIELNSVSNSAVRLRGLRRSRFREELQLTGGTGRTAPFVAVPPQGVHQPALRPFWLAARAVRGDDGCAGTMNPLLARSLQNAPAIQDHSYAPGVPKPSRGNRQSDGGPDTREKRPAVLRSAGRKRGGSAGVSATVYLVPPRTSDPTGGRSHRLNRSAG